MKTLLLALSLCLTSLLLADEAEEAPIEELTIDPLIAMKEQFAKARKKGWDFSAEKKKSEPQQKSDGIDFGFTIIPPNYHPMQKSEEMAKAFRSDISETERANRLNRIHDIESSYKYPGQRSKSR